jgi:hypothetical protein
VGIVPPLRPGSLAGRPIALAIIVLIRSLGSPGVTSSFLRHSTALHLCGRSDTLVPQAPRSRPAGACATATLVHRGQNQGSSDRFAAGRLPHYLYFRLDCLERRHLIYARGLSPSALPPTTRVWSPSAVCHDLMILDDYLLPAPRTLCGHPSCGRGKSPAKTSSSSSISLISASGSMSSPNGSRSRACMMSFLLGRRQPMPRMRGRLVAVHRAV